LRLLGAGRPTLVTASGSFAELPPGVAAQVDADASEGELIAAYCRLLLDRPDLAAALGAGARAYVAREHTLDGAAAGYIRFLAARYGWDDAGKLRKQPLWEPTTDQRRPTNDQQPTTTDQREHKIQNIEQSDDRQWTTGYGLPTDHAARNLILNSQFAPVAEALTELGVTEDDTPLLEGAARAAAELFGET
jgi:hypothetical protein